MGVNSLWEIVGPAARPVKLEALLRKKLAVDALIWIYQFLKAVRDKEGNSIGPSHIVGFFRRICKLLYYGILPVFVFDGGAPALKRQVIQKRREQREGNQEVAAVTAQKLLAMQLQRQLQDGSSGHGKQSRLQKVKNPDSDTQPTNSPDAVYLEDLPNLHPEHGRAEPVVVVSAESSPNRKFLKKDEYHLPELKKFKVSKNDMRIMPESEYEEYAGNADFDVVDGVDINTVDPNSKEFLELPLATQYMVLNHLRLRSRLRLGYSKNQLEELFPNGLDFSKFQIQQVQKRNFYTQRLMTVSGMGEDSGLLTKRIAGDKDKQYALVKNEDGWTLALAGDDPIEIDERPVDLIGPSEMMAPNRSLNFASLTEVKQAEEEEGDDSDDLEDVPFGKNDESDDDMEIAVVESIYDQFKGDYENTAPLALHSDLRLVIEATKQSYNREKQEEIAVLKKLDGAHAQAPKPEFNFAQSMLFATEPLEKEELNSCVEEKANPVNEDKIGGTVDSSLGSPIKSKRVVLDVDALDGDDSETDHRESVLSSRPMPAWFGEKTSQVENPHASTGFVDERPQNANSRGQNDEDYFISWSEAQEMIREKKKEEEEEESDVEFVGENPIQAAEMIAEQNPDKKTENSDEQRAEFEEKKELMTSKLRATKKGMRVGSKPNFAAIPADSKLRRTNRVSKEQDNSTEGDSTTEVPPFPGKRKATQIDYEIREEDEEDLLKLLREEEEQHNDFELSMRTKLSLQVNTRITDEQLLQERASKAKRDADEVTETMINDVQELLRRFGIPYITAPMEAEAQCVELLKLGLVDGIVTDDSDCLLFGGLRIYKNMFNQKHYVECYLGEDIISKIGLDQEKLIMLAQLLGSDYTDGIKGIGPVLAMEILAEFKTLEKFKAWYDMHTKTFARKDEELSTLQKNLLNRVKKGALHVPENFPSSVVHKAYTNAEVDHDESDFKWGYPSLDQIRTFLMYNVGWNQTRVDEVMVPLIQDMNRKRAEGTQLTIGEFFPQEYISHKKGLGLGKRMHAAARKLRQ